MSKDIKIYQLLKDLQLSTCFLVGGKVVPVTFQNGITRPYLVRGRFSTSDPELQAAIESDNSFGKLFHLERIEKGTPEEKTPEAIVPETVVAPEEPAKPEEVISEPEKTVEEVKAPEQPVSPENPVVPETVIETPSVPTITDYPEVTNLQEARQKMFELFPGIYKPANLPNKQAVLNKAKEKNITFSKLG